MDNYIVIVADIALSGAIKGHALPSMMAHTCTLGSEVGGPQAQALGSF